MPPGMRPLGVVVVEGVVCSFSFSYLPASHLSFFASLRCPRGSQFENHRCGLAALFSNKHQSLPCP